VKVNELLSHAMSVSGEFTDRTYDPSGRTAFGWNGCRRESHPLTLECSVRRVCWSDRRQTSQHDVSERFGVAQAIEASDFDQLAPKDGLQAFAAIKVRRNVIFDRWPRSIKSSFRNLAVDSGRIDL
jgi:hypothetical protein